MTEQYQCLYGVVTGMRCKATAEPFSNWCAAHRPTVTHVVQSKRSKRQWIAAFIAGLLTAPCTALTISFVFTEMEYARYLSAAVTCTIGAGVVVLLCWLATALIDPQ